MPQDPAESSQGWSSTPLYQAGEGAPALCREPSGAREYRLPGGPLTDFDAGVRARARPGGREGFGLAFRQRDGSYYLVRANSRNNNVRLYRREGTSWTLLAGRDLAVPVGQWRELVVRARGATLTVGLDREPLFQVTDARFSSGEIALWADEGTAACFADLWVTPRNADS